MSTTLDTWATWREIHQQPAVWRAWGNALDVTGLRSWIAAQNADEVWFCGAGTSAYICRLYTSDAADASHTIDPCGLDDL